MHEHFFVTGNAVVLGFVIEVNGSVSGTVFVNDTFVEVSAGLENLVSPIGEPTGHGTGKNGAA